jgi:divalent metal cation (Fe/Co/Zn/Cd) transporter
MNVAASPLVRRGQRLAWLTIGWNTIEGIVAIASGTVAGSIALVGFGVDSFVEVFAGAVIVWRLAQERHGHHASQAAERRAVMLIASTFFLLAVGIAVESLRKLIGGEHAEASIVGIIVTIVSLIVMPVLARAKRRVGRAMGSRAVEADATETTLCVWLSAIVLAGLLLNGLLGWWWADPLAALGIVYVAGREGIAHWNNDSVDDCC